MTKEQAEQKKIEHKWMIGKSFTHREYPTIVVVKALIIHEQKDNYRVNVISDNFVDDLDLFLNIYLPV